MSNLPLCKCGCGIRVVRRTKKYFEDHYKNPVGALVEDFSMVDPEMLAEAEDVAVVELPPIKPKVIVKSKSKAPLKKVAVKTRSRHREKTPGPTDKLPTRKISGGKISKQNLLNVGLGIYTC
jgi:hypothetical protein